MKKTSRYIDQQANRTLQAQYERDCMLLDRRVRLDYLAQQSRQDHEWRMMLTEKLCIALFVGAMMAFITLYGNFILERYKSSIDLQQVKASLTRSASDDLWTKLVACENAVYEFKSSVEAMQRDNMFGFFKGQIPKDREAAEAAKSRSEKAIGELWESARTRTLDLDPAMRAWFFRAVQDVAMLNAIYEGEYGSAVVPHGHDDYSQKIDDNAEKATQADLAKREDELTRIRDQLY